METWYISPNITSDNVRWLCFRIGLCLCVCVCLWALLSRRQIAPAETGNTPLIFGTDSVSDPGSPSHRIIAGVALSLSLASALLVQISRSSCSVFTYHNVSIDWCNVIDVFYRILRKFIAFCMCALTCVFSWNTPIIENFSQLQQQRSHDTEANTWTFMFVDALRSPAKTHAVQFIISDMNVGQSFDEIF